MDSRSYTVHIYEDEASRISKWTLQYPNIATGGDIFGLWLNENDIVIQAVLGPGANCRRSSTSFFQDEQYLSRAAKLLSISQGLCHVGSWHSSHMMNLPDPSPSDKDTVWQHLLTPGKFLLLIATIEVNAEAPKVQMSFNLFESFNEGNNVAPMELKILEGQSPIRANEAISRQMLEGAELTAEVHSGKISYSELESSMQSGLTEPEGNQKSNVGLKMNVQTCRKPDVHESARYNDENLLFKGRKSSHCGDFLPMQQYAYCDGDSTLEKSSIRKDESTLKTISARKSNLKPETSLPTKDRSAPKDDSTPKTNSTPFQSPASKMNVQRKRKHDTKKQYNPRGKDNFFTDTQSSRQGHGQSLQDKARDGVRLCHTFPLSHSEVPFPKQHRQAKHKQRPGDKMYVEQEEGGHYTCWRPHRCTIL